MDRHCFVIQRFDGERYDQRFFDIIKPVVESCQLEAYRVDQDPSAEVIIDRVMEKIKSAAIVIAEISTDRPNVWFELGYAVALSKPIIMMCDSIRTEIPFDIRHQNILFYRTNSSSDFDALKHNLRERIVSKIGIQEKGERTLSDLEISILRKFALDQRTENAITPEKKITEESPSEDAVRFSLRSLIKSGYLAYYYSTEPNTAFYQITNKAEKYLKHIK